MESTCVLLKPDAMKRGLCGQIITRFEDANLRISASKIVRMNDELLEAHYHHVAQEKFFAGLKEFMKSAPVLAIVISGENAIEIVRTMCGKNFEDKGTIRGDFAKNSQQNIIHSSDSKENATIEIERFFNQEEIIL